MIVAPVVVVVVIVAYSLLIRVSHFFALRLLLC